MSDKINLKEMEQKAYRLMNEDGLMELLIGAILFVASGSFSGTSSLGGLLAIYILFLKPIMESYKKKYTYPRIGYLKLPNEDSPKIGIGILTFMGGAMLTLLALIYLLYGKITSEIIYQWIPLLIGLIFTGGFTYHHGKSGDKYTYVYIAVAVGAGLVFSLLEFSEKMGGAQFYTLFLSTFFFIAGVVRLQSFRKKHPVQPIPEGVS